jgi:GNAT superfamily N-acetyltransferase
MAEYDRSATGPLPVDAGPRRAESIFDLSPEDFRASLGEMQAMGHDTDALMRQYRAFNSPFAGINNAAAAQQQGLADSGRRSVLGGLLSKPEGAIGMDALAGLEFEGLGGLLGAGQAIGQGLDAPAAAAQGLIPQADVNMEALNTAGMAMGAGGAATAPAGALRSGLARGAGFDDIKAAFPDVRIDIGGSPETGFTLGKIIVPEGGRGAGVGTQVMEAITRRADELGGQVNLTPSADFGGNVGRLRDFYARQGFVRNTGRNRDFSTQEDMYRTAQANASQSGGLLGAGLSEAQRQARDILDMRAAGNARSVTDDMMARADDQYMFDNTPLPMDVGSRMDRAAERFDQQPLYHGTASDVQGFDNNQRGSVTQVPSARAAHWLTGRYDVAGPYAELASTKPVQELMDASRNAEIDGNWDLAESLMADAERLEQTGGSGQNVMQVFGPRDVKSFDADGASYDPTDYPLMDKITAARGDNYEGVRINNFVDNADWGSGRAASHIGVFDPTNIRSRFARFDPEFSHLSNLSAANASPTAGLLASGAQEQDKPLPFMEMLRGLLR